MRLWLAIGGQDEIGQHRSAGGNVRLVEAPVREAVEERKSAANVAIHLIARADNPLDHAASCRFPPEHPTHRCPANSQHDGDLGDICPFSLG